MNNGAHTTGHASTTLWGSNPGDPIDGGYIAREMDVLAGILAADQRQRDEAAAEDAMAALLATLED